MLRDSWKSSSRKWSSGKYYLSLIYLIFSKAKNEKLNEEVLEAEASRDKKKEEVEELRRENDEKEG